MTLKFGGHATFTLRALWPKKAYDTIRKNHALFRDPKAIGLLGMGKNMIDSLKFWNEALGLIETQNGKSNSTPLGREFLKDKGLDPFLENPATIWIFHYNLAISSIGGVWHWLFNHYQTTEFTVQQALTEIEHWLEKQAKVKKPSSNTLRRDLDCCIRCYTPPLRNSHDSELDCPLKELGLLKRTKHSILMTRCHRPNLSPWVTLGALVDYWKHHHANSKTLSLEQCLYPSQSPGKLFRLDSATMIEQLASIEQFTKGKFRWSEAAGLQQISYKGNLDDPINYWNKAYAAKKIN